MIKGALGGGMRLKLRTPASLEEYVCLFGELHERTQRVHFGHLAESDKITSNECVCVYKHAL